MKQLSFLAVFLLIAIQSFSQILEPVQWSFETRQRGEETQLVFKAVIDDGWHLYDTQLPEGGALPTSINYNDETLFELVGELRSTPAPVEKFDQSFQMNLRYFENNVELIQTVKAKSNDPVVIEGFIEFMVCDDERCLPPTEVDFSFRIEGRGNDKPQAANAAGGDAGKPAEREAAGLEAKSSDESLSTPSSGNDLTQAVADDKQESNQQQGEANSDATTTQVTSATVVTSTGQESSPEALWTFFFFSFLAGLAALLTPCVFPMIPMTVSFFMHGAETKGKSRMNAIFYGLSIIAIYTLIGTLVSLIFGPNIANWLSTHWLPNLVFFAVFFIFAFSFFGMFEIVLPSWMVNKSDKHADKGGLMGSFFMALTLVLVSFSCTGPIVGAILVKSFGGQVLTPVIGMFGFSLAFALPFTLFALFPAWLSNLPKSGGWLNSVKVVLGFLELALGLKFLSIADQTYHWRLLDREVYLAMWIVIFALMGVYLLGKLKFAHDSEVKHVTVPRLLLAIVSFSFVVYMAPGMFGAPLKAISGYLPPMTTHDFDLHSIIRNEVKLAASSGLSSGKRNNEMCEDPKFADFLKLPHGLEGFFDFEQGMACAKAVNKPVFIDFTGHGCVNCREMEATVWSDPRVLQRLQNDFIIIALYVDDKTTLPEEEWVTSTYDGKVKKTLGRKYADFQITRFGVNAQPFYVLLDHDGNLLAQPKAYDLNPNRFVEFLDEGLRAFRQDN